MRPLLKLTKPLTHAASQLVGLSLLGLVGSQCTSSLMPLACNLVFRPCFFFPVAPGLQGSISLFLRHIHTLDTIDTDSVALERIGIGQCCWRSLHANNRVSTLPTRVHPRASCGSFFLRPSHRVIPSILRLDFLNILKLCVSQSISPSHIQIDL